MCKQLMDSEIENILRSYPRLKVKASISREKLYNMFPNCISQADGMPKAVGGISRQTESYGIKNAENNDYTYSKALQTNQQVRVIELIYESFTVDCRDLVKYYYFEKLRRCEVQTKLNLSDGQFKVRRREVLDLVADILKTTAEQPENDLITAYNVVNQ